jgi:hypothetical protein
VLSDYSRHSMGGQQDEKSCTLTTPEYSMYLHPTLELLLRLVAAWKCPPHFAVATESPILHSLAQGQSDESNFRWVSNW